MQSFPWAVLGSFVKRLGVIALTALVVLLPTALVGLALPETTPEQGLSLVAAVAIGVLFVIVAGRLIRSCATHFGRRSNSWLITRIANGLAGATILAALLYVPLGLCGVEVCHYEGHGWLLVNHYVPTPAPEAYAETRSRNRFLPPTPPQDNRRDLIRDRLLTQLAASLAAAGMLIATGRVWRRA